MTEWTPKKAATLGLVFSGASVVFLAAVIATMNWQQGRSPGQKDWSIVFAAGLGVPFVCCLLAALLSLVVSASLLAYRGLFRAKPSPSSRAGVSTTHRRKVQHPALISFASFAVLMIASRFGTAVLFLVGFPAFLIGSAIAGGARPPTKIPLRDAILYVGISVALVTGLTIYAVYKH